MNRDDSDRLKPCPFCGAEAEIITLEGETDEPSIGAQCVQCTSSACGAAGGLIYPLMDDVTDLLRERWNKRHNQYDTADEIKQLRLAEEGAKEAFGHVVQQKRDLEAECKRLRGLLDGAYDTIRRQTPNAELNGARRASDLSAGLGNKR